MNRRIEEGVREIGSVIARVRIPPAPLVPGNALNHVSGGGGESEMPARHEYSCVKSMRFASVVEKAGRPDVHLLLVDLARDTALQKAIKARRVMTVHQASTGNSADYGVVGFEKGAAGQVLVFPQSIRSFEGVRIVGVKYELLEGASVSKDPRRRPPGKRKPALEGAPRKPRAQPPSVPSGKVVEFPPPEEDGDEKVATEMENGIRRALHLLEAGKPVAAFNLLKRLVD